MTILARTTGAMQSSTVAIGAAAAFVAMSAVLALMSTRDDIGAPRGDWSLRGTIAPNDVRPLDSKRPTV